MFTVFIINEIFKTQILWRHVFILNIYIKCYRSSDPGVFCKKGVLRNFAKLIGKAQVFNQKTSFFSFCELQLITVLSLICNSYMSWSTRFFSLKLCGWFSIFDSASFLLKFTFFFNKTHGLFDFKTS